MNTLWPLVILTAFTQFVACRDFYLGMFRRNDFLVAQDVLYKAPSPFGYTTASYGRLFKCPITYFRVVDRLGMGRGPITTIVRGGLLKKYITVRIKSTYRLPVSVNIYVGCENKQPSTFRSTSVTLPSTVQSTDSAADTTKSEDTNTEAEKDGPIPTTVGPDNSAKDDAPKDEKKPDDDKPKEPDDEKKDDSVTANPENPESPGEPENPETPEEPAPES